MGRTGEETEEVVEEKEKETDGGRGTSSFCAAVPSHAEVVSPMPRAKVCSLSPVLLPSPTPSFAAPFPLANLDLKLQALVYDILPPTTALTDYATGLKECWLMDSFSSFGAQMAVTL